MPRDQLLGLAADVDRLLAAGATAAVGHDGLSRRGRTLRELGQKVAALRPVADAVERVTTAGPREVGRAFLDLLGMARQLRGSLAGVGPAGTLQTVHESGPWQTPMATRDVYNAHDALTADASAAVLRETAERQVSGDLRLLPSALAALESSKSSIADPVADKILPAVGRSVLPDLLAKLDLKGKAADARRLRAICKIDPEIGAELCRKGLSEGSPPLKIQALHCLPDVGLPGEAEKIALEMWQEKKNELRLAALSALSKAMGDEALEILLQALLTGQNGNIIRTAQAVLAELPHPKTTERLLRELEQRLAALPSPAPKPKKGAAADRNYAAEILHYPIETLSARKDARKPRVVKILLDLTHHAEAPIRLAAVEALARLGLGVKAVLPALIQSLRDADSDVADAAMAALIDFPVQKREAAIPTLLERAADPKAHDSLICSLVKILPQHMNRFGAKILDVLRLLLKRTNESVRRDVIDALTEIGPPAGQLLPEILEQMKLGGIRGNYLQHFVKIEPEGTTAIPALIQLLEEGKADVRAVALEGLGGYGPKARAAEPLVTKLLKDRDWNVIYMAHYVLGAFQRKM